jgi:Flp pilus assembly protein TadD
VAQQRSEANRSARISTLKDLLRRTQETASSGAGGNAANNVQRQEWEAELAALEATGGTSRGSQPPPGLLLSLGSAYFRSGRLADAEREYRAAIAAQPKLAEAHNNLAVVLLMTGRPADAKEEIKLAKKSGYKVPPGLEADVEKALKSTK